MIIHRTSYGFYDKNSDEKKIIDDCKRSNGNASKVYHKIDSNGEIITTKYFDEDTELLKICTTSIEMKIKSKLQRHWVVEKHKILESNDLESKKQDNFDILCKKYNFKRTRNMDGSRFVDNT